MTGQPKTRVVNTAPNSNYISSALSDYNLLMTKLSTTILLTTLVLGVLLQRSQFSSMAEKLNKMNLSWKAGLSPDIDYDDEPGLKRRLGAILTFVPPLKNDTTDVTTTDVTTTDGSDGDKTIPSNENASVGNSTTTSRPRKLQATVYPESLDLRLKYPKCQSISLIRNQSRCGSCWAFSSMNSLSDRFCIAKSTATSTQQRFFSVQDVLECCQTCNGGSGNGCRGGMPYYAFLYAQQTGIVSGETLSNNGFCKPYYLEVKMNYEMRAPACSAVCTNPRGFFPTYALDKLKIRGVTYGSGEAQMIAALNNGGSISVSYMVYQDFYAYRSGIYSHVTGSALGGHAVRLIGYGVENGVKFWLLANSWGNFWGENGFFRMKRGTNDCGIESNYFAAGLI